MSENVELTVSHRLGREEALRRIRQRCDAAEERRTIAFLRHETQWSEDGGIFAASALGQTFRGQLRVGHDAAQLTLHVPGMASLLSDSIATLLREEANRLLNRNGIAAPTEAKIDASGRPGQRQRSRAGTGAEDAIIGVIAGYGWHDVHVWANSLAETGFAGDRVLIALDVSQDLVTSLQQAGFKLVLPSSEERLRGDNGFAPLMVERFQLIADFLSSPRYRYVVITDVRDVVFQANPSAWMEANLNGAGLLASSEGVRLGDEWWGRYMLESHFGREALKAVRDCESRNAGVIAGTQEHCRRICLDIVRLCTGGAKDTADQAAYNLLLGREPWLSEARTVHHDESWACQAGTVADPRQMPLLRDKLIDVLPCFDGAVVRTPAGDPYAIVHQYDRVPEWRAVFESRFR